MRILAVTVLLLCSALLSGCGKDFESFASRRLMSYAKPSAGLLPPVVNPITQTNKILRNLPPPKQKVAVAVYGYRDQTGQHKQMETSSSLSKAVTQGATSVLIKALQDAGEGSWFMVVEREMLGNLLKERNIIASMRKIYLGEQTVNTKALPPLLFAGIILEGGIIGYDTNTISGGLGARYLGIGGDVQYRQDTVTVYLRAVSTKTGQVLASVVAHKTILAYGIRGSIFKYIALDRLAEGELGFSKNEPDQIAVQQAIEKAVLNLIIEGTEKGLWMFSSKKRQRNMQQEYYTEQFGSEEAQKKILQRRRRQWQMSQRKKRLKQKTASKKVKRPSTVGSIRSRKALPVRKVQVAPGQRVLPAQQKKVVKGVASVRPAKRVKSANELDMDKVKIITRTIPQKNRQAIGINGNGAISMRTLNSGPGQKVR